jgi:hypothetical protein
MKAKMKKQMKGFMQTYFGEDIPQADDFKCAWELKDEDVFDPEVLKICCLI